MKGKNKNLHKLSTLKKYRLKEFKENLDKMRMKEKKKIIFPVGVGIP